MRRWCQVPINWSQALNIEETSLQLQQGSAASTSGIYQTLLENAMIFSFVINPPFKYTKLEDRQCQDDHEQNQGLGGCKTILSVEIEAAENLLHDDVCGSDWTTGG